MGERLCHTFEVYRAVIPQARLTMEHFLLLVSALAEGYEIELDHCVECSAVLIVERMSRERRICFACREMDSDRTRSLGHDITEAQEEGVPSGVQRPLF